MIKRLASLRIHMGGLATSFTVAALALAAPSTGQTAQAEQEIPTLKLVAAAETSASPHALWSETGQRLGTRAIDGDQVRVTLTNGTEFSTPRYQRWAISGDGRTVVAAGDPRMPEHPFQLAVQVYRDGRRVAAPGPILDPESTITVGHDGRVALVGHLPGEREQWFAVVLAADGKEEFRQPLPSGRQARDPVLFSDYLLVRTHGLFTDGQDSAVLRVDRIGVEPFYSAPEALQLIGFPEVERALVRSSNRLEWIDTRNGRLLWERVLAIRPASSHAVVLLRTDAGNSIAVVESNVQRRGEPEPPVALTLFETESGRVSASTRLERSGPLGELRLSENGEQLTVSWMSKQEVYTWSR